MADKLYHKEMKAQFEYSEALCSQGEFTIFAFLLQANTGK